MNAEQRKSRLAMFHKAVRKRAPVKVRWRNLGGTIEPGVNGGNVLQVSDDGNFLKLDRLDFGPPHGLLETAVPLDAIAFAHRDGALVLTVDRFTAPGYGA